MAQHPVRNNTCQPRELSRNCSRGFLRLSLYTTKILFHKSEHPQLLAFKRNSLIRLRLSCPKKETCHGIPWPSNGHSHAVKSVFWDAIHWVLHGGLAPVARLAHGHRVCPATLFISRIKVVNLFLYSNFGSFRHSTSSHFHSPSCAVGLRAASLSSETVSGTTTSFGGVAMLQKCCLASTKFVSCT